MAARLPRREALKLLGSITGLGILTACSSSSTPADSKPADAKPAATTAAAPAAAAQPTTAAKPAEAAKPTEAPKPAAQAPAAGGTVFEIQHWHTLTASDADVWGQQIENANKALTDQKLHARLPSASTSGSASRSSRPTSGASSTTRRARADVRSRFFRAQSIGAVT